jgi:hypothetical protein
MSRTGPPRERDPQRAAAAISMLVTAQTGLQIDTADIIALFRKRWQSLSLLAHDLHESLGIDNAPRIDPGTNRAE